MTISEKENASNVVWVDQDWFCERLDVTFHALMWMRRDHIDEFPKIHSIIPKPHSDPPDFWMIFMRSEIEVWIAKQKFWIPKKKDGDQRKVRKPPSKK
jgi:hypothetical protein